MSTDAASDAPAAYDHLPDRYRRVSNVRQASTFLNWDQQVTMPQGGAPGRAKRPTASSAGASSDPSTSG